MSNSDDELVRTILRPVRGCATDSQYCDAYDRAAIALTTARREAQEEAFREASNLVHAMSRLEARGKSFDFLSGAAWMQNKVALLLAQRGVEAAAITKKGDTDAR